MRRGAYAWRLFVWHSELEAGTATVPLCSCVITQQDSASALYWQQYCNNWDVQLAIRSSNNHWATRATKATTTTTASRWHFVCVRPLGVRLVWEAAWCCASVNYYCGSMWLGGGWLWPDQGQGQGQGTLQISPVVRVVLSLACTWNCQQVRRMHCNNIYRYNTYAQIHRYKDTQIRIVGSEINLSCSWLPWRSWCLYAWTINKNFVDCLCNKNAIVIKCRECVTTATLPPCPRNNKNYQGYAWQTFSIVRRSRAWIMLQIDHK